VRLIDPWAEGCPRFPLTEGARDIHPDGYFELREGREDGASLAFIIEAETGSRNLADVLRKINAQAQRLWELRRALASRVRGDAEARMREFVPGAHPRMFDDLFAKLRPAVTPVFDFDGLCPTLIVYPTVAMAERMHAYALGALETQRGELADYLRLRDELKPLGVDAGWFFAITSLEDAEARGPLEGIYRLLARYEGRRSVSLEGIWDAYERCLDVQEGQRIGDPERWFHENASEELLRRLEEYREYSR